MGFVNYNKSAFTPLGMTGFTLIEITIALLILAVGLVGILALFPVGFDAAGRASNVTVATFKAQEIIEELKRDGYNSAMGRDDEIGWCTEDPLERLTKYDYFEYEIQVDDSMFGSLAGSICEVTVTVWWPAPGLADGLPGNRADQRNVELNTYIAKYEP